MQDEFIQERKYLHGVSARTVDWYENSFRQFKGALDSKQTVIERIKVLKERGASNITINSYLRCVNAYFMWRHKERGQELLRIPKLREESKILATLSTDMVSKIITYKPTRSANLIRAHLVALTVLDCGLRASEVLGLTKENVNLDALTLTVLGKGGKHRVVPISVELRKTLFRFLGRSTARYVFGTKNNTQVSVHNLNREFRILGKKLGLTGIPAIIRS